jgi:hypothetical protein
MRLGKVDGVIMVGDMMDWGRGVFGEDEYEAYLARFRGIFRVGEGVGMWYVAGNHDVVSLSSINVGAAVVEIETEHGDDPLRSPGTRAESAV